MEPGSGVSRFRHYMGAVSGWECCDGEEGSRGLTASSSGLLLCCFHNSCGLVAIYPSLAPAQYGYIHYFDPLLQPSAMAHSHY